MGLNRPHTPTERMRLSDFMKLRHRKAKLLAKITTTAGDSPKSSTPVETSKMHSVGSLAAKNQAAQAHRLPGDPTKPIGRLRTFAEMVLRGFASKRAVTALPQAVAPVVDEHAVEPVVAHPRFPTEDSIARSAIRTYGDDTGNLRGLMEEFNRGRHSRKG